MFGLMSCGGSSGGSGTIINPPPVQAQTFSYSAAALDGTYTISMIEGDDASAVSPVTFIGSLVFDGAGNISSGTINGATTTYGGVASGVTTACPLTASGKYTLSTNATGTATLTLAGASVSATANANGGDAFVDGCYTVPPQLSFSIAAAQQGQTFVFQMAPGPSAVNFSGSGFKQ